MKLLPCQSPGCRALGAACRGGEPYFAGRFVRKYRCARCKKPVTLTVAEWARLPNLTLDALPTGLALGDMIGAGLSEREARDMFNAGFQTSPEIAALERTDQKP